MSLVALLLRSGGMDLACRACLPEARRESAGSLVTTALVVAEGEVCSYCGVPSEQAALG